VPGVTLYALRVADSTGVSFTRWYTATEARCASGTCQVTPATALSPGAAQWWLRTRNAAGYGPWSAGHAFTITQTIPNDLVALEERALQLVNLERTRNGLRPLLLDERVGQVARAHSQDMVDRQFFAHVNPDGEDPFERVAAEGIVFTAAAENIAFNAGAADPVALAVQGWMNSPGHRANILNAVYVSTGIGVARHGTGAQTTYYFTQNFIRP
jgi:uncharacterized protein YkwD